MRLDLLIVSVQHAVDPTGATTAADTTGAASGVVFRTTMAARNAALEDLLCGERRNDQEKASLLKTREVVERGWKAMGEMLTREGDRELAEQVSRFVERMPPASAE
jgi:hypothetical protein